MNNVFFFIYFLIGLISTIAGAISGIGGGVIIKPVLDSISSFNIATIGFLTGNTVLSMTFSSIIRNRNSSFKINKRISIFIALGSIAGGLLGKALFDMLRSGYWDDSLLAIFQSVILIILITGVLIFTLKKKHIKPIHLENNISCFITGLILGCIASFLGIGGGPFNVAALYFFFSMDSKTAAINSIFIIFMSQLTNLIFTVLTGKVPDFNFFILIIMITGGISGGIIGSKLLKKISHKQVDNLFSFVMVLIIMICTYNLVKWLK